MGRRPCPSSVLTPDISREMLLTLRSASSPPMALIPASNTSRALAYDFPVALSSGDCAKEVNDTNRHNAIHNLFGIRVSSENQFVVPPLGGSVECRPIP